MTGKTLKTIPFPECSKNCASIEYFGVCECESICPWKFDIDGNSISEGELSNVKNSKA